MKCSNDDNEERKDLWSESNVISSTDVSAPTCSRFIQSAGNGSPSSPVVLDEKSSSSSKTLSLPKYYSMIRMREKLLKKIRQLEEREVFFDDEAKETFYISHEIKLKKALLEIEKSLHKYGALEDLDDDLKAFYNGTTTAEVNITDTGNEYLNRRLSEFINEKIARKERIVTPSFDEIRDIMHEIRAEHGSLSGIPDPYKEWDSFLDRLENVAFVVVRSHQSLITGQFFEHVDQYVPEPDRPMASKLPELSSGMSELLTADGNTLPDEVFRMEIQAAAKLELENPQTTTDEDIDSIVDEESDYSRGDEYSDDEETGNEETGLTESPVPPQCSDPGGKPYKDNQVPFTFGDCLAAEEVCIDSDVVAAPPDSVSVFRLLAETLCANASSNVHCPADVCKLDSEDSIVKEQVMQRVTSWLQFVEPEKIPVIEMTDDDLKKMEIQRNSVKREFHDGDNKANSDHTFDLSDDEIEFLGVFTKSPDCEPIAADYAAKRRCPDLVGNSTDSMSPPHTDLISADE